MINVSTGKILDNLADNMGLKAVNASTNTYKAVAWDKIAVTRKRGMLRNARLERKAAGKFSVKIEDKNPIIKS